MFFGYAIDASVIERHAEEFVYIGSSTFSR
jgi:hypothetical protein